MEDTRKLELLRKEVNELKVKLIKDELLELVKPLYNQSINSIYLHTGNLCSWPIYNDEIYDFSQIEIANCKLYCYNDNVLLCSILDDEHNILGVSEYELSNDYYETHSEFLMKLSRLLVKYQISFGEEFTFTYD